MEFPELPVEQIIGPPGGELPDLSERQCAIGIVDARHQLDRDGQPLGGRQGRQVLTAMRTTVSPAPMAITPGASRR